MPTLRETIAHALLGQEWLQEQDRIKQSVKAIFDAYLEGPYQLPPDELFRQLGEYDSATLEDLVYQLGYDQIGWLTTYSATQDDSARKRAIQESRRLYLYDVITERVVSTWTNYGFGERIDIVPNEQNAVDIWDEFWAADRNSQVLSDDKLQYLSERVLVDGEIFFTFFISRDNGLVTIRLTKTDNILDIITDPQDSSTPWFYKREIVGDDEKNIMLLYPDYLLKVSDERDLQEAKDTTREKFKAGGEIAFADEYREETDICVIHVAHNIKVGLRGFPLMVAGAPWVRAHKRFREDRSSVAAAVAMFVRKIQTKGGSRGVQAIRRQLASTLSASNFNDTNPATAAGGTFIENESASLENFKMTTGASDAKTDGEALLMMAGLGGGLYPHWLGAGDAFRLATATAMEGPVLRQFSRYQLFWSSQFRKVVRVVLWAQEEYNKAVYNDYGAEVTIDRLLETDLEMITESVSQFTDEVVIPAYEQGLLPQPIVQDILAYLIQVELQALGSDNIEDIIDEDAMKTAQEMLAEFSPGQTLSQIITEYSAKLYSAMMGYFNNPGRPITAFRNEFRRVVNDGFTAAFYTGMVDATEGMSPVKPTREDISWLNSRIAAEIGYADALFQDMKSIRNTPEYKTADGEVFSSQHAASYSNTVSGIYNEGKVRGLKNQMLTFDGTDGTESCATCQRLKGVSKPASWWVQNGLIPGQAGNRNYDCGGWNCQHYLRDAEGNIVTEF